MAVTVPTFSFDSIQTKGQIASLWTSFTETPIYLGISEKKRKPKNFVYSAT